MPGAIADFLKHVDRQILVFVVACAVVISIALGLERFGGYVPCELCLKERYAYYVGIPLAIAAYYAFADGRREIAAALIGLAGLGLLANAGLGLYHAGVEWQWWAGPSTCTGGADLATTGDDLLKSLQNQNVVRCDQPALKILGLSLAAWNIPIGIALAALAGHATQLTMRPAVSA